MIGFYPLWRIGALEHLMDAQAAQGNALTRRSLFSCTFRADARARGQIHRIGASGSRIGSAGEAAYCLGWQKKGWERFASSGKLLFFRAPDGTPLPDDDGLPALLQAAMHRRERWRNIMLVVAAFPMIVGYAMEGFTVVRLSAIPLAVALILSWTASRLQKAIGARA